MKVVPVNINTSDKSASVVWAPHSFTPTLVAVASAAALLSACGGGESTSASSTAASSQTSATSTSAEVAAPSLRETAKAADPAAPSAVGKFAIGHSVDVVETAETPISLAYLNDHVAGSKGPVKNVGGKFYVGTERLRIYGIVFYNGANIPNKADAIKIAKRLRKEGFNGVRMIGFDKELAKSGTYQVTHLDQGVLNDDHTLNAGAMDMFDHFVYQLQQQGIYVQIPMKVSRKYLESRDCIDYCEGIDTYMPELIASQKKHAAALLNHVNPYTGRAYKNDPGVLAFEISNESSLSHRWSNGTLDEYMTHSAFYPKYGAPLVAKWAAWAQAKYGTPEAAAAAWGTTAVPWSSLRIPLKANKATTSTKLYSDFALFVGDIDAGYMRDMYNYIKNTIGTSTLVLGTQSHYSPMYARDSSDISDYHSYFGANPVDTGIKNPTNGRPVFSVDNKSLLMYADPMNTSLFGIHERKAVDKPNMISEYVHRYGNQYIAESEPIISAYAGFQDIDAIFMTNAHNMNLNTNPDYYSGWYNNSVSAVSRVSAALAFRRGDMTPGAPFVLKKTKQTYVNTAGTFKNFNLINFHFGGSVRAPIVMNTYQQLVDSLAEESIIKYTPPADNIYTVSTGQITWKPLDRMVINSPMTKTVVGLFNKTPIDMGSGIKVNLGSTMSNFAVVQLSSLAKGAALPSQKMLLSLTGYWNVPGEYKYPRAAGSTNFSWGTDVPRIESITSTVRITTPLNLVVTALDATGARKASVPVVRNGADIEFVTGPAYDTGWYLIEDSSATAPPTNASPTATLSAPSTATVGVATALNSSASDSDGTIAKVDFYEGTTLIGSDTTAPFSVPWTPATAGTKTLTSRATDNKGASTTSAAISVNVVSGTNALPTATISAASSATVRVATTLSASASDSDGSIVKVEFLDGGAVVGTDTTAPYSVSWTPTTAGSRSLTARATDDKGATKTSAAVTVSVTSPVNVAPSVSLNVASSATAGTPFDINATASDSDGTIAKVEFFNGTTLIGTDTSSPYSLTVTPSAAGTYSLTARATDNDGATRTTAVSTVNVASAPVSGSGIVAQYYTNATLSGTPAVTRVEDVSHVWGTAAPAAGIPADNWSARWNGSVIAPVSGSYTFQITADDGIRARINGTLVLNNWATAGSGNNTYTVLTMNLKAGDKIPVTIEHFDLSGGSTMMLRWKTPTSGGYWADIPVAQLSTTQAPTTDNSIPASTTGLSASYFANTSLSGTPALVRTDDANFTWGADAPAAGLPADGWSARWTGSVVVPAAGSYIFQVVGDDGVRAQINGAQIANQWAGSGNQKYQTGVLTLAAGARVPVSIDHYDGTGDSTLRLRWMTPTSNGYWQDIPLNQLRPN